MSSPIDRDAGFYDNDAGASALVAQQRAEAVDGVRSTNALSVTWLDADGGGATHWGYVAEGEIGASAFLVYALCRAWRDAAAALAVDDDKLTALVRDALHRGIGA